MSVLRPLTNATSSSSAVAADASKQLQNKPLAALAVDPPTTASTRSDSFARGASNAAVSDAVAKPKAAASGLFDLVAQLAGGDAPELGADGDYIAYPVTAATATVPGISQVYASYAPEQQVTPTQAALRALADATVAPTALAGTEWVAAGDDFALYPNGLPSASDINQRQVNDCFLDSGLASIAEANPELIQNAIHQDAKDPTQFTVDMYAPDGSQISVAVNNDVMADAEGNDIGVTGADGKSNWASIMEKAYAKYNDQFKVGGRIGSEGMESLNGGSADSAFAAFTGPNAVWGDTVDITDDAEFAQALQAGIQSGIPTTGMTSEDSLANGERIIANHAYSVSSVYQDSAGDWRVQVRNPWGKDASDALGTNNVYSADATEGTFETDQDYDNGLVDMSMDEFKNAFSSYASGDPSATTQTSLNMNMRISSWQAAQMAKNKSPDKFLQGDTASVTFVAGADVRGDLQIQVFEKSENNAGESNFLGGALLLPNTSYKIDETWVNVDGSGKPTTASKAANGTKQMIYNPANVTFETA